MTTAKPVSRLTPRTIASGFANSVWLTVLCAALALSAGLTLFGGLQEFGSSLDGLGSVSIVFNGLYAVAACFLLFRLFRLRGTPERKICGQAATGAMVLFIVLTVTVLFLVLFYYSSYSILAAMTEEQFAEAGISAEYVENTWALLPLLIVSLTVSALEAASAALFWRSLRRLSSMCAGRGEGSNVFTACFIVSMLTAGAHLCMMVINMRLQSNAVYAVLMLVSGLPNAAVYASVSILTRQVSSDLQA